MTQQQEQHLNQLTASIFRQLYYSKMLNIEHEYYLKLSGNSGVKNVLHRLKTAYHTGVTQLLSYVGIESQKVIRAEMQTSDEKIRVTLEIVLKVFGDKYSSKLP
jgi:hypothetical protein